MRLVIWYAIAPIMTSLLLWVMVYRQETLQRRYNDRDDTSNHQPLYCLLNHLFRRRWKKTSKLRITGICKGNLLLTGGFPSQRASNVGNVSIWWHHHDMIPYDEGQGTLNNGVVRKRIRAMCKKKLTRNFDIVTRNFDLANSKFRHTNSKFRLRNSKFRLTNSKFRHS